MSNNCPICNKEVHETKSKVYCPQYKALVCMGHCFKECEYLENTSSITFCKFNYNKK